jgi:hypothetical protein
MDTTPAAVRDAILAERGGHGGSWPWTLRFLAAADRMSGGAWRLVTLTGDEARRILLPPHAGEPCHGDRVPLVGSGGSTVAQAVSALAADRDRYERANRECWRRIAAAAGAPFSTLVLIDQPLDTDEHRELRPEPGRLYHLDGFHRLVGWGWAGRLTPDARVAAFIAEANRRLSS